MHLANYAKITGSRRGPGNLLARNNAEAVGEAKLQPDELQAYATFGLLRSTLPAHCGEAALSVILHRRTHANERTSKTGQTSSSFGFIGAQIPISANAPAEDIPLSGCGLPICRVRCSFGSRETRHR